MARVCLLARAGRQERRGAEGPVPVRARGEREGPGSAPRRRLGVSAPTFSDIPTEFFPLPFRRLRLSSPAVFTSFGRRVEAHVWRPPMADLISTPSFRDWPPYWFAELENALEQGNFQAAARAVSELRRLGIEVRYLRGLARVKEVPHAY